MLAKHAKLRESTQNCAKARESHAKATRKHKEARGGFLDDFLDDFL
jgi:hypothetical protein